MRYTNLLKTDKKGRQYVVNFDIKFTTDNFVYKIYKYNNEKLDYLADKIYGDGSLWWIIATFNEINNPLKITLDYLLIPTDVQAIFDYVLANTQ